MSAEWLKSCPFDFILFFTICLFDLFNLRRHIYTCENFCKEDKSIALADGAIKIFLNAMGTLDDISHELKAFLDYVVGIRSEDAFVRKLEEAVKEARKTENGGMSI